MTDLWWGFVIGGSIMGAIASTIAAVVVGTFAGRRRYDTYCDSEVTK